MVLHQTKGTSFCFSEFFLFFHLCVVKHNGWDYSVVSVRFPPGKLLVHSWRQKRFYKEDFTTVQYGLSISEEPYYIRFKAALGKIHTLNCSHFIISWHHRCFCTYETFALTGVRLKHMKKFPKHQERALSKYGSGETHLLFFPLVSPGWSLYRRHVVHKWQQKTVPQCFLVVLMLVLLLRRRL